MVAPVLGILGLITKVVSNLLPGKSKEVIDATVNQIITTDKEIQEWIKQQNEFILNYEGKAELMSKVVNILRAIPRPFITISVMIIVFKYLWLNIAMPDKLWYLAGGIFGFYFYFRHKEKVNGIGL